MASKGVKHAAKRSADLSVSVTGQHPRNPVLRSICIDLSRKWASADAKQKKQGRAA